MTTKERRDRQVAAIRAAIHEGVRPPLETRKDIRAPLKAQREPMATLKRGGNGLSEAKLDLQ